MADTVRTLTALQALLANNSSRAISEQDVRDALYSALGVVPYVAKTANYTATENDEFIAVATSSGDITITLPAVATTRAGKRFCIKKTDANAHDVVIDPNSTETIDGSSSSLHITAQYEAIVIVSSASAWLVESHYVP